MNIIVLNEFPEPALNVLRQAVPGAGMHYFPGAQWSDLPSDITRIAEVLYTSRDLPMPDAAPKLQWVQAHSAGVDQFIDHPLFRRAHDGRNDIQLTTASGVHAINISEYIVMMMLALSHNLPVAFRMMRQGSWNAQRQQFMPRELHGATVGLVGYGAIGRHTAGLCLTLGMRVLALRRNGSDDDKSVRFYTREQLKSMLGESDYVVLALPLSLDSYHLVDADALAAMKESAFLINISRGDIVDETAMMAALKSGHLAGAALDVFQREPLPDDSPLWQMDNVILTPHIAGISPNYELRAAELFADNLRRFAAGQQLINRVDFVRGY